MKYFINMKRSKSRMHTFIKGLIKYNETIHIMRDKKKKNNYMMTEADARFITS